MPNQFWHLTVREFWIKHDGFMRAENRAQWLNAHLALLMNGPEKYKSKPQSPGQLLGYRGGSVLIRYPVKKWLSPPSP